VQFFLYGDLGAGKTEFVWQLVAQIGAQTFIVAAADEAGAENNRCGRLALQAEIRVQREQATAAESKATQLEARIADLKAELDRALKHAQTEREAALGARKEAQAAAVEGAALKGELAAVRGSKKKAESGVAPGSTAARQSGIRAELM